MIKIEINKSTVDKLINYHANYIKTTVSENWDQIVGKYVNKIKVTKNELDDIMMP